MSRLRPGGADLTRRALSFCRIGPLSRILDIGCGNGESLALIREEFACLVAGLEPDAQRLRCARAANPGVEISPAKAEAIPFADHSFDIVLGECTASLFDQPEQAFAEISRVLTAHGCLVLTDVYAKNAGSARGKGLIRHLYTREEFAAFLQAAGLMVRHGEDCGDMLKTMLGQLILDFGATEAYRRIGLEPCALKSAHAGYILIVAEKEKP